MNGNERGVAFTADEVRTLLKFASKESSDRDKYGVKILVAGDEVFARATNGQNRLELNGESNGQLHDGEWFVHREFLERAVKTVVGVKAVLRLAFSGASLNHALIEENDIETGSYDVPKDAAVADVSFPWGKEKLDIPSRGRRIAHCSAIPGAYAALIQDVEGALGASTADLYPPQDPDHPWIFVVNDGGSTTAIGSLKCALSVASTSETDDDKPSRGKGRKKDSRQQEIAH